MRLALRRPLRLLLSFGWIALIAALAPLPSAHARPPRTSAGRQAQLTLTGQAVPELASYDRIVGDLMTKWRIPGGAVAVVKDGRLVYARGFGWADRERREPARPDSLFRIASLSKSLTAAAILKLAEDGKLSLEDKAFSYLGDLAPPPGHARNPQLERITLLELLQHSGGWDRDTTFDPMFRSEEIVRTLKVPAPASAEATLRYMLDRPLQADPGTRYAYSNFGYCVLGRIVERVAKQSYERYVQEQILRPAGVTAMRLGRTWLRARAPGEVRYYGEPGSDDAASVFSDGPRRVPWPYGGWSIEAMDAHGGWIASVVDMARFVDAVDGRGSRPGHPQVLRPASIQRMIARPAAPLWPKGDTWYGLGWQVRPVGGDANWWHTGSLDGTTTLMVRAGNGATWLAFFNSRPEKSDEMTGELDRAMWQAFDAVKKWPEGDLFPHFAPGPAR